MTARAGGWNYRVVRTSTEDMDFYAIWECYYEEGQGSYDVPGSWIDGPRTPIGNDKDDLIGAIGLMLQAFSKPVLTMKDGKLVEDKDGD